MIRIAAAGVLAAFCYMTLIPIVGDLRILPDLKGGPKAAAGRAAKGPSEKKPQDFRDDDDLFSARFPASPTSSRQRFGGLGAIERTYNARCEGVDYIAAVHDLGYDLSSETGFNVKWIADRFVQRAGVKAGRTSLLRPCEHVIGADMSGRWDGNSARIWRCRFYIVRKYVIVVEVVGPTEQFDEAEAKAFFDSFKLTDKSLDMQPYRPERPRPAG